MIERNSKDRLKELQLKNRRMKMIKEHIENLPLTEESFVDITESKRLCASAIQTADKIGCSKEFDKDPNLLMKSLLTVKQKLSSVPENDLVLFQNGYLDVGAIIIKFSKFWEDLDLMLDLSRIVDGYGQLVAVGKDLEYGICIFRLEYTYKLLTWGI